MNVLDPTHAAYIAGVIEGDGHIGLVRRKNSWRKDGTSRGSYLRPIVQIGQAKPELLEHIMFLVGEGKIAHYKQRCFYNLRYFPTVLRELLPQLLPFLFIKRRQAEIVLEFLECCAYKPQWGKVLPETVLQRREVLAQECTRLNMKPGTLAKLAGAEVS